jgi:hypothetical protein
MKVFFFFLRHRCGNASPTAVCRWYCCYNYGSSLPLLQLSKQSLPFYITSHYSIDNTSQCNVYPHAGMSHAHLRETSVHALSTDVTHQVAACHMCKL